MKPARLIILLAVFCALSSCADRTRPDRGTGMEYAEWLELEGNQAILHSPFGAPDDTLTIHGPMHSIVCMSSSYIGFLDALGCDSVVTAVSGLNYVADPDVRARAVDVGYDAALDYETILKLNPDLLITYAVSAAEPPYLQKLRELGIRTAVIHEHLESHPLARAEYIKLFGLLTGRSHEADSLFSGIRDRYRSLVKETDSPRKVLINIPYADQWYIPGGDNYMTRLIRDAGGEVLGARPGETRSRVISREEALLLARQADVWLNPGWCDSRAALQATLPAFPQVPAVYNNTRRTTPGGGNDFWESGPVRPDLILQDLRRILAGNAHTDSLYYYIPLR